MRRVKAGKSKQTNCPPGLQLTLIMELHECGLIVVIAIMRGLCISVKLLCHDLSAVRKKTSLF